MSEIKLKECKACRGLQPLESFVMNKYERDGYSKFCRLCHAQRLRLSRKKKYNAKSRVDDSIIRTVAHHNREILGEALTSHEVDLLGFSTITKENYKVSFRPYEAGYKTMSIFKASGELLREYTFRYHENSVDGLLSLLREFSIRLERTEADMIQSKTTIYYL